MTIQLELDEGFYWISVEDDDPEIGWYDEVTDGWWTTSSDREIDASRGSVRVVSKQLTYTGEEI